MAPAGNTVAAAERLAQTDVRQAGRTITEEAALTVVLLFVPVLTVRSMTWQFVAKVPRHRAEDRRAEDGSSTGKVRRGTLPGTARIRALKDRLRTADAGHSIRRHNNDT